MKINNNGKWEDVRFKVGDTLPIGSITAFGGSNPPSGWLICDGSAISRTEYASLFAAIGTTYGTGDGNTTFNLPNLQGKVLVGKSNETEFNSLGKSGGEKTHILTINEMPAHNHKMSSYWPNAGTTEGGVTIQSSAAQGNWWAAGCEPSGGDQAHNNLQPYSVTNYIIKAHNNAAVVAKVEQDLSSDSEINVPSTLAVKTAIGNATKDIYSTEEQVIGTWYNGKTLYRKSIQKTYSERWGFTDILLSNIDEGFILFGYIQGSGGGKISIPNSDKANLIVRSNGNMELESPSSAATISYDITVIYTKITD